LDPDLFALGPERVRDFAEKHQVFVTAGVDSALLREGPVEEIAARIRHYIDVLGRNGGFSIYLNQIAAETPPDHIHVAVAACKTYGRLPIADDLDQVPFTPPRREGFEEYLKNRGTVS
ncbi:MAG: hypothetical protein JRJ16_18900, partial [Deltaproteobacteria bacterium]|nr:hypothetical protein [Deltaproteobacteria bacterium]